MVKGVIEIIRYLVASLTLLLLSGNTIGSQMNCITRIMVPRNTLFRAPVMTVLKINCSATNECPKKIPRILWCKIYGNHCNTLNDSNYIKSELRNITKYHGISFLTFMNISVEDEGLYRCKVDETSVSHTINVTVTVGNEVSHNQSKTDDLNKIPGLQWLWPYVYICSGIVGLVVIVMTVSLLIFRWQGTKSARNNKTTKNQYIGTQRSDQAPPSHPHHNTHSPSAQLTSACVYETSPIKTVSSSGRFSANKVASKGGHNNVSTEGEENVLVYASLNHHTMPRRPKRTAQQEPEPSEYAAIRFR